MNTGIFNVSKPIFFLSEERKFILGWGEHQLDDEITIDLNRSTLLKGVNDELTPEERGDVSRLTVTVSWLSTDSKGRAIWSGRITAVE